MGFEMRRATLGLLERLRESDWNMAAVGMNPWGRDRAKWAPMLYQGWVGGCWGVTPARGAVGLLTSQTGAGAGQWDAGEAA